MAKNQTNEATNSSSNLLNQSQGLAGPGSPIMTGFQSSLGTAQSNQASELSSASTGIGTAQQYGGYNPATLSTLQNQTGVNAATGGYTPGQTTSLNSGGYDPSQLSQIQSGYGAMASTGGYTPTQANQFIQQATEGTTGTYGVLENQLQQSKAATGGLGTGGAYSQMARQLGQAQASNTLNAEVALNSQENSNKLSGLGGLSSSAASVAGNTLQGQESLASNKLAGTNQELGLGSSVASGVTTANSQMSQLYNTTTGQVTALGQQVLSTLGLDFSTQEAATNSLATLSKNPGLLQTTLGDLAGLGGAAAGAAGALGVTA